MKNTQFFTDLATKLTETLPIHLGSFKDDFKKHCQALLSNSFDQLGLISREEFDAQTKVLARTRQKLESLQQKLTTLETLLKKT